MVLFLIRLVDIRKELGTRHVHIFLKEDVITCNCQSAQAIRFSASSAVHDEHEPQALCFHAKFLKSQLSWVILPDSSFVTHPDHPDIKFICHQTTAATVGPSIYPLIIDGEIEKRAQLRLSVLSQDTPIPVFCKLRWVVIALLPSLDINVSISYLSSICPCFSFYGNYLLAV